MKSFLTRLGAYVMLAVLWLLHGLPLAWQAALGHAVGGLLWRLARSRRRVVLTNLALCFPEMPAPERERLGREVFTWFSRSVLERGLLWFASPARLKRLIHVEGDPGFADRHSGPVMWLVPHFVGLDVAGVATQLNIRRGLDLPGAVQPGDRCSHASRTPAPRQHRTFCPRRDRASADAGGPQRHGVFQPARHGLR